VLTFSSPPTLKKFALSSYEFCPELYSFVKAVCLYSFVIGFPSASLEYSLTVGLSSG
jgi:hypothetical protein